VDWASPSPRFLTKMKSYLHGVATVAHGMTCHAAHAMVVRMRRWCATKRARAATNVPMRNGHASNVIVS